MRSSNNIQGPAFVPEGVVKTVCKMCVYYTPLRKGDAALSRFIPLAVELAEIILRRHHVQATPTMQVKEAMYIQHPVLWIV